MLHKLYRDCSNKWRHEIHSLKMEKEDEVIKSNNLGTFYKFVNKWLKYRNIIGALVDDSGKIITNDDDKANLFNDYFSSVGVVDKNVTPVCNCNSVLHDDCVLDMVEFNTQNTLAAMLKLSSGPDGLPPLLFKRLRHCLGEPLALLFFQLFSVSDVPSD